jgi:oxygen-independent coproporphyrinogen-3 oxidase
MIGVYIHIPFCRTRCPYCDFVSEAIAGDAPQTYVDTLCREIASFAGPAEAGSVFFGGGTPSLLTPQQLEQTMEAVRRRFTWLDPEITLEANPDDVTEGLAAAWREAGISRVSLGVQSFHDDTLGYLGRRHDAAGARRACGIVAGRFDNWNMDLIFGTPPVAAWRYTLAECVRWSPPHVAAYGLTYEKGTPFEARAQDALEDDAALELYQHAETALQAYEHYEISNYAKPGRRARHNLIYWHNEEYAGFGTGAYSYLDGVRARNLLTTPEYLAQPGVKAESLKLTAAEIRVETVIQHLRLHEGLPKRTYHGRFGHEVGKDFGPQLAALIDRGLIIEDATALRPTPEGFYLNNEIGLALVEAISS